MASFNFKTWCEENGLKEETIAELSKNDLDSPQALKLVSAEEVGALSLTLGQRKLFLHAVQELRGLGPMVKSEAPQSNNHSAGTPVTTGSLAKDGGLEEILKKIEGASLDDPLYTLGATEQNASFSASPLGRLDQDPQVFLGSSTKKGEPKPMDNSPTAISRRALLVGPSYRLLPKEYHLLGVEYDLEVMENVTKTVKFGNVEKVAGDKATKKGILDALEDLSNSADPGCVVLIYYSGHGCYLPDTKDEGLAPADITSDMMEEGKEDYFITGKDLLPFLEQLTNKNVKLTVIFDCCHSGQLYRIIKLRNSGCTDNMIPKQVIVNKSPSGVKSKGTGTKMMRGGWEPKEKDVFFYIAACSPEQLAFEERGEGGLLTKAIKSVIEDIGSRSNSFENVSNMAFFRRIEREFQEKGWSEKQTPQMEGLSSDTELFGVEKVQCMSGIPVKVVIGDEVILNSGRLQNLLTGVYNVFESQSKVLAGSINLGKDASDWLGTIDVSEGLIGPIETSSVIIERHPDKTIRAGCLAYLADRSNNFKTNARIKTTSDDCIPKENIDKLVDNIKKTQLLNAFKEPFEEEDKDDSITIGIELFENISGNKEKVWVARQRGDIIVPPSVLGQEKTMADNLNLKLRFKAALAAAKSPKNRDKLLENVSVKVVKIENVEPFTAHSKEKRIQEGLESGKDLYEDAFQEPVLKSHSLIDPKSAKLKDRTGDALVFQVTNNNAEIKDTVHICVLFFQFDGAIKAIYPPKEGGTAELRGNDTAEDIFRVCIPFNSLRKMAEPDPNKPEPDRGVDTIVVYAASKPANFKELLQTAIETDRTLVARGKEKKTEPLSDLADFLSVLRKRCLEDHSDEEDFKWFVEKKEFAVVKNTA